MVTFRELYLDLITEKLSQTTFTEFHQLLDQMQNILGIEMEYFLQQFINIVIVISDCALLWRCRVNPTFRVQRTLRLLQSINNGNDKHLTTINSLISMKQLCVLSASVCTITEKNY